MSIELLRSDAEMIVDLYAAIGEICEIELCRALDIPTNSIGRVRLFLVSRLATHDKRSVLYFEYFWNHHHLIEWKFNMQMISQIFLHFSIRHHQRNRNGNHKTSSNCSPLIIYPDYFLHVASGVDGHVEDVVVFSVAERCVLDVDTAELFLLGCLEGV